jgi:hypothetical protein
MKVPTRKLKDLVGTMYEWKRKRSKAVSVSIDLDNSPLHSIAVHYKWYFEDEDYSVQFRDRIMLYDIYIIPCKTIRDVLLALREFDIDLYTAMRTICPDDTRCAFRMAANK